MQHFKGVVALGRSSVVVKGSSKRRGRRHAGGYPDIGTWVLVLVVPFMTFMLFCCLLPGKDITSTGQRHERHL